MSAAVQENLKEEQQLFVHANSVLLKDILSPIQAALFMLQSWPAHCDCFGFANYVASEVSLRASHPALPCMAVSVGLHNQSLSP